MATHKFIVLDTETAPLFATANPIAKYSRVYDLGYMVCDKHGAVYERGSFVIFETYANTDMMLSAYYADKLPQYDRDILAGERAVVTCEEARAIIRDAVERWSVRTVWAYNARFDRDALNATAQAYDGADFLPECVRVRDIWDATGATICATKKFVYFCRENNYMTAKGNPSTTAEVVYRYLQNDTAFVEQHTALCDCEIEFEILRRVYRRKRRMPATMGQGWRKAASINKATA